MKSSTGFRLKITVRAGEAMEVHFPPGKGREQAMLAATEELMCRIAAMLPEKYRGVYANHPRLKELLETHALCDPLAGPPGF